MSVLIVVCCGPVQAAPDDGWAMRAFLAGYRCPVLDRLERIAAHEPNTTQDRFLVLWPKGQEGRYVQCIFAAGNVAVDCEAASGAYDGADAHPSDPKVVAGLAAIGFRLADPAKNYVLRVPLDRSRTLRSIADRMLLALYVFGARQGSSIVLSAPYGSKGNGCSPTS